jgi:hypothetical protein
VTRVLVLDVAALLPDPDYAPPPTACAEDGCRRAAVWRVKGGPVLFRTSFDDYRCVPCSQARLDRWVRRGRRGWLSTVPCSVAAFGRAARLDWRHP